MTIVVWVLSLSVTPLTSLFLSSLFIFGLIIRFVFASHLSFFLLNFFLSFSGSYRILFSKFLFCLSGLYRVFPYRFLNLFGNFRLFPNRSSGLFFSVSFLRLFRRYRFLFIWPFSLFSLSGLFRVSFCNSLASLWIFSKSLSFSDRLWIFLFIHLAFSSCSFAKNILVSRCVVLHQWDRLVDLTELLLL